MQNLGVVFSGQGSQYIGMGKKLCQESVEAKKLFDRASDILNFDLYKMCTKSNENELTKTINAQPAIFTYSVALYRDFVKKYNYKPIIFAGHSLGEYSALTCAGCINFEEALRIVRIRGELMSSVAGNGTMAAIMGVDSYEIAEYCKKVSTEDKILSISNYNTEEQTIVSGDMDLVEDACEYFRDRAVNVKRLDVSGAFHSSLMKGICRRFESELDKVKIFNPKYNIISNVDGKIYKNSDDIKGKLVKQLYSPVKWIDTMDRFCSNKIDTVIEFGPKKTIRNFFKSISKEIKCYSYEVEEDYEKINSDIIATNNIVYDMKDFMDRCISIVACTKNNSFDKKQYNEDVINACYKIRTMQENIEGSYKENREILNKVLKLTQKAMDCKKVSNIEQKERLIDLENKCRNFDIENLIKDFIILNKYEVGANES